MRIRFFNTYEVVSPFYRDLLPFLACNGIDVEVLISSAEYRPIRGPLEEAVSQRTVRVTRINANGVKPDTGAHKLWIMASYMVGTMLHTLFGRSADTNVFLTQPPLFALWGYVLRILRNQAYCCVTMDIYPDLAIVDGLLKRGTLIARALTGLSRFALRRADRVVVIGRCMKERVEAMGVQSDRIQYVPNWSNQDQVLPVPPSENELRRALGLHEDFIVLYSGNMGTSHHFDDLIEVARRCRDISGLRFVFIGDGRRRPEIKEATCEHVLDNVLLLPFQPIECLSESLSLGDVHFVSLREGFEGLVVPSKAYGALAAGRPIVYQGSPTGEIAQMIRENDIGVVVPIGDIDGLQQALLTYLQDRSLLRRQGQRARQLAETRYSHQMAYRRYAAALGVELEDTRP